MGAECCAACLLLSAATIAYSCTMRLAIKAVRAPPDRLQLQDASQCRSSLSATTRWCVWFLQDQPLIYNMKWRFWFFKETETPPAPFQEVVQFNWVRHKLAPTPHLLRCRTSSVAAPPHKPPSHLTLIASSHLTSSHLTAPPPLPPFCSRASPASASVPSENAGSAVFAGWNGAYQHSEDAVDTAAPPSTFSRCFNRDGEGASAKRSAVGLNPTPPR